MPHCSDCKFYHDEDVPDTIGCGECICNPPTAIEPHGGNTHYMGHFPLVSEYMSCGKFEMKNKTE